MRYTPMSVSEQCNVEREMLEHLDMLPSPWSNLQRRTSVTPMGRTRPLPKKTTQALNISQAFFAIASAIDAPIDCEEMELAIRYKMGYGWLAWFLFRNFAVPIIKWLWARYHNPDLSGAPV